MKLVPQNAAVVKNSSCIGLDKDHCSIAKLDWLSYAMISQHVKDFIGRYRMSS